MVVLKLGAVLRNVKVFEEEEIEIPVLGTKKKVGPSTEFIVVVLPPLPEPHVPIVQTKGLTEETLRQLPIFPATVVEVFVPPCGPRKTVD